MRTNTAVLEAMFNGELGIKTLSKNNKEFTEKAAKFTFKMVSEHGMSKEKVLKFIQSKLI